MAMVSTRGVDFYYRESGRGPCLFFIHGAAGSADAWSPVFDLLAGDHRVIAYDRRAHARSAAEPPAPAGAFATHADDAAALIEALSAAPAIVVGWSNGGLIALHLACRHPGLVAGLILEEPPFRVSMSLTPEARAVFQHVGHLAGRRKLREAAETFVRWASAYRTGGSAFDRFDPALRESMLANAGVLLTELQAGTGEELGDGELQRIACPVTCLVGDLTPRVIVEGTDRLIGLVPHARVTRIADAAHAMHFDQPERFTDALRSAAAASAWLAVNEGAR